MPSRSLQNWFTARAASLAEIENAHRSVGGSGPGRRYATQQINQAYAVLLAAQFQGFCRDLHSECVDFLVGCVMPTSLRPIVRNNLTHNRQLNRGNATPVNLASDFDRLGVSFLLDLDADDPKNRQRLTRIEELNTWRNAIAHQDFDPAKLGGTMILTLKRVKWWRKACDALVHSFDRVMAARLQSIFGVPPW